jgi:hypothetical protein
VTGAYKLIRLIESITRTAARSLLWEKIEIGGFLWSIEVVIRVVRESLARIVKDKIWMSVSLVIKNPQIIF